MMGLSDSESESPWGSEDLLDAMDQIKTFMENVHLCQGPDRPQDNADQVDLLLP